MNTFHQVERIDNGDDPELNALFIDMGQGRYMNGMPIDMSSQIRMNIEGFVKQYVIPDGEKEEKVVKPTPSSKKGDEMSKADREELRKLDLIIESISSNTTVGGAVI